MLKYIIALFLATAIATAQPFPPREGPVIIAPTGGSSSSSSGGVDTNAVIALIQQYGGGGGLVSNANNLTFTSTTIYTNNTSYRLALNVLVQERGATANGLSLATLDIDTGPDGAFDYARIFSLASSATFTNSTMITHTIEPGYAWRVTTSGGAAITSSGGQLLYFSTNSSSGGGGSGSGNGNATNFFTTLGGRISTNETVVNQYSITIAGCDTNLFNTTWYWASNSGPIGFYYAPTVPSSTLLKNLSGILYVITNAANSPDDNTAFYRPDAASDWAIDLDVFPGMSNVDGTNYLASLTGNAFVAHESNVVYSAAQQYYFDGTNSCQVFNVNSEKLPLTKARTRANQYVTAMCIGDDAIDFHFNLYKLWGDALGSNGVYMGYGTTNGPGRYRASNGGSLSTEVWFGDMYCMAAGSAFTNGIVPGFAQTFNTTDIGLAFYRSNDFTTLTVLTQSGASATATFRTVVCDNNTTMTPHYTNWSLPAMIPALKVIVTSSGTNIIVGVTQVNSNVAGVNLGFKVGGNIGIQSLSETTILSNSFREFFGNKVHLTWLHDLNSVTLITNGAYLTETALLGLNPMDFLYTSGTPSTNNTGNYYSDLLQRQTWFDTAQQFNRPCFDTFNLFLPRSKYASWWGADGVHMNAPAAARAANAVWAWMNIRPEKFAPPPQNNKPFAWKTEVMSDGSLYYIPLYRGTNQP